MKIQLLTVLSPNPRFRRAEVRFRLLLDDVDDADALAVAEKVRALLRTQLGESLVPGVSLLGETVAGVPGSDLMHPPIGYRLGITGEKRPDGYIWWDSDMRAWRPGLNVLVGREIYSSENGVAFPVHFETSENKESKL